MNLSTQTTELIVPDWPAPTSVKSVITTRALPGHSQPPYDSFNLATHVGDDPEAVAANRGSLYQLCRAQASEQTALPQEPLWLNQTHSTLAVDAAVTPQGAEADASFTNQSGIVCSVMTADCLPLLICDHKASGVAAIHAGWRGLADGIIENTVQALLARLNGKSDVQMRTQAQDLMVYLGPAISGDAFEVGPEVREIFVNHDQQATQAFSPGEQAGHYMADIYALARLRLATLGISQVYGGNYCTYGQSERFYSYRRDGKTGRMASLIWLED